MDRLPQIVEFYDDESVESLIYRLAAGNGFFASWDVLRYLGNPNRMHQSFSPVMQAGLSTLSGIPLEVIAARCISDETYTSFFGREVRSYTLRLNTNRICRSCARENGYHRQMWLLGTANFCPYHSERLINTCPHPNCGLPLKRYRRHFFKCSRGHDILADAEFEPVPEAELFISRIQYEYFGRPASWQSELARVDKRFRELSFHDLMDTAALCGAFAYGYQNRQGSAHYSYPIGELAGGLRLLQNWPFTFRTVIEDKLRSSPAHVVKYGTLAGRMLRLGDSPGAKIVVQELNECVNAIQGESGVSQWHKPPEQRVVSGHTLAKRLNTTVGIIRRTAKENGWSIINERSLQSFSLRLTDVKDWDPSNDRKTMTPQDVQQRLGLQRNVVEELIGKEAFGAIDQSGRVKYKRGLRIPEEAIADFEAKIISASAESVKPAGEAHMYRQYKFRLREELSYSAADFLLAAAAGKLRITDAVPGRFSYIRYLKAGVDELMGDESISRQLAGQGLMSIKDAVDRAQIGRDQLVAVLNQGLLKHVQRAEFGGKFVEIASLNAFLGQYTTVTRLAATHSMCDASTRLKLAKYRSCRQSITENRALYLYRIADMISLGALADFANLRHSESEFLEAA